MCSDLWPGKLLLLKCSLISPRKSSWNKLLKLRALAWFAQKCVLFRHQREVMLIKVHGTFSWLYKLFLDIHEACQTLNAITFSLGNILYRVGGGRKKLAGKIELRAAFLFLSACKTFFEKWVKSKTFSCLGWGFMMMSTVDGKQDGRNQTFSIT